MKFILLCAVVLTACGDDATSRPVEELRDPNTCKECHEQHFTQWEGSMHAYASDDPVFVAMNKRGQRETGNALGDFCVKCHAPMAVVLGLTDGIDFDPATLPPEARGITCYYCHNVAEVTETHNNGLVLANDQTMRGGLKNPVETSAHFAKYDPLMDSDTNQSEMCGSCHDIIVPEKINGVPGGVALERTFAEWKDTFFATETDPNLHFTCGACHMPSHRLDLVADAPGLGTSPRENAYHDHLWPGIDQALDAFPGITTQADAIADILDPSVRIIGPFNEITGKQPGGICLDPNNKLDIRIDNLGAGHSFPSGAGQDRRMWLEVKATDAAGATIFESGVVLDGQDPNDTPGVQNVDTVGFWDRTFKADDTPALMFWDVARVESQMLPSAPVAGADHSVHAVFDIANAQLIDRIETRLLIRPMPHEVLNDLVASGDLAPDVPAKMKTLVIGGGTSVWTRATKGTGAAINTNCNPKQIAE